MWRRSLVFCCAAFVLTSYGFGQAPQGPKRPGPGGPRERMESKEDETKSHPAQMKSHRSHAKQADSDKRRPEHVKSDQKHNGKAKTHRVTPENHGSHKFGGRPSSSSAAMMHVDAMMKRLDRNHDEQLSRDELAGMMKMFAARAGHPGSFGPPRGMMQGPPSKGPQGNQQFARHRFHPDVNARLHYPPRGSENKAAGQGPRPERNRGEAREPQQRGPEGRDQGQRDWEAMKADSRWPEHREPEQREPLKRGPEHRRPQSGKPEQRGPEQRGPEQRGPEQRGPEQRGPEQRGPEQRGPEQRGPEQRGPEQRGPERPDAE